MTTYGSMLKSKKMNKRDQQFKEVFGEAYSNCTNETKVKLLSTSYPVEAYNPQWILDLDKRNILNRINSKKNSYEATLSDLKKLFLLTDDPKEELKLLEKIQRLIHNRLKIEQVQYRRNLESSRVVRYDSCDFRYEGEGYVSVFEPDICNDFAVPLPRVRFV